MPQHPFLFLRHGQTDWNVAGRKQGHTDIPLNATGLAQAHAAALKLAPHQPHVILTSPLSRAHQTAEVVAQALGLPLQSDPLLIERSFGSFEGKTRAELLAEGKLAADADWQHHVPADGEAWPATLARARAAIARHVNAHPGKTVLFVSHGAFFRALYESLGGPFHRAENATPYRFTPNPPSWQLDEIF